MTVPAFRIGFTGSTLDELLPWIDQQVGDSDRVVVSMAGSGKDIAYLARAGRTITSWDPQYLSWCVVNGVFAAPADCPPPVEPGEHDGLAWALRPIKGMPDDAAVVVDYIAVYGSDYDRVCLAKALIGSTYMGRLGVWARDATAASVVDRYRASHAKLQAWRGLPGTFDHHLGSVFDEGVWFREVVADAVLLIDTPKVLTNSKRGGDLYSRGWAGLNSILAQSRQVLPPWTEETFLRDMPVLWNAPWERMLFFHATGCLPDPVEVVRAMTYDGVPTATLYQEWEHKGRADLCWVVDRGEPPALVPVAEGQLAMPL